MTDPLEELQAETARKLVVSLREELATEKRRHLTFIAEHNFDALTALRSELAEAKAALEKMRARVGELEGALREIQNEGAHADTSVCVAQLRCGHCNEWCEPACPSCGHELLEHVPSTAAPVPPEPEPKAPEPFDDAASAYYGCVTCDEPATAKRQNGEPVCALHAAPVPPESVRAEDPHGSEICVDCGERYDAAPRADCKVWRHRRNAATASEPKTSAAVCRCGHGLRGHFGDGKRACMQDQCPCDRWEPKTSAAAGVVCECGHTEAEHGQPGCLYECCLGFRPALDALRAAPAPREPCCDLASRGTHRKGCSGEPRSRQLADALGREAPLTDAELLSRADQHALRAMIGYIARCGSRTLGEDALAACRAAVAARKEPKP